MLGIMDATIWSCLPIDRLFDEQGRRVVQDIEKLRKARPIRTEFDDLEDEAEWNLEDCTLFGHQVEQLECVLRQLYGTSIAATSREKNLTTIRKVWESYLDLIDGALAVLAALRQERPECGSPETYDKALDLRSLARQRLDDLAEEEGWDGAIGDDAISRSLRSE